MQAKRILFLPVIKWNVVVSRKGHIRFFREAMIRKQIKSTKVTMKKSNISVLDPTYLRVMLTFLSSFSVTIWEIASNFLGNLEQLVESLSYAMIFFL